MWGRQGSEAGSPPVVVLLVEAGVRGVREEGGESEKEMRMRQEMEGQREVRELWVLEESQEEEHQALVHLGFPAVVPLSYHSLHLLLCFFPLHSLPLPPPCSH